MALLPPGLEKKILKKRIPTDVIMELTYKCHLDCVMCYLHEIQKELTTDQIKNILDELAREGCIFLMFTGGETFLRKDLFQLLDYATDKGFVVTLKTTATMMTDEAARKIKEMGIKEVQISILGSTPDVHDEVTAKKGSFSKMIDGIKLLRKHGVRIATRTILTHGHVDEIDKITKLALDLGIGEDDIQFDTTMFPKTDSSRLPLKYQLTDSELSQVFKMLKSQHVEEFPFVNPYEPYDDEELACSAGRNSFTIQPNGTIVTCMSIPIPIGNILKQSMRSIINGPENVRITEAIKVSNNKDCSVCDSRMGCFRCPGLSYQEHGKFGQAATDSCRQTKIKKESVYGIEAEELVA